MTFLETLEQDLAVKVERYQEQRTLVFGNAAKISAQRKVVQQAAQAVADNPNWKSDREAALVNVWNTEKAKLANLENNQIALKVEYDKRIAEKLRVEKRIEEYKAAVIANTATKGEAAAMEQAQMESEQKEEVYQDLKNQEEQAKNGNNTQTVKYVLIGLGVLTLIVVSIVVVKKIRKNKKKAD